MKDNGGLFNSTYCNINFARINVQKGLNEKHLSLFQLGLIKGVFQTLNQNLERD